MTPVFVGSAFKNKGVQPLLDGVVDYLPSPLDVPPVEGKTLDGEPVVREADENAPLSALAFKVQSDPHVGKLTYMRVYSGTPQAGSSGHHPHTRTRGRVGGPARARPGRPPTSRTRPGAVASGWVGSCSSTPTAGSSATRSTPASW